MTAALFFIVNPSANHGKALRDWEQVRSHLGKQQIKYDFALSKSADDVELIAREAAFIPGALIVGVGGDGTLQRIAAAISGTDAILGTIPAGRGNDFARSWQIPHDVEAACDVLLHGRTVAVDLGRCNGTCFLNVLGTGMDAEVTREANVRFKRFSGTVGYLLALLRQLVVYKPCKVQILLDNEPVSDEVWLVAVANACYYGGGMKVAPDADPRDGLADIVVVGRVSRLKFLQLFPRVYSGRHVTHPAVRVFRASTVEITAERELAIQADGETVGTTPFTVTMEHQAIRLRIPAE
jgi:diacylglycerol kinase (ATP)